MKLKQYQRDLLDAYEGFLRGCREIGRPDHAFMDSTAEFLDVPVPYCPLPGVEQTPYVCLRVPTGGGKTLLAAHAIPRVNRSFFQKDRSLVLWLVPSEAILTQTLRVLSKPGEMLREHLVEMLGVESFSVIDIEQSLALQPSELETRTVILVCTMQSFKQTEQERLRTYRANGALMSHGKFMERKPGEPEGISLFDVIRSRRPFVVVDEAHNQGTELATDTLANMAPGAVLELTATPDRAHQPSNVLRSVSAATLQAEDMLKLPVELAVHGEWKVAFREALACLEGLGAEALEEEKVTGERIRPVMLLQAERKSRDHESFTDDRVKALLMSEFGIAEGEIAICTGSTDELGEQLTMKLFEGGVDRISFVSWLDHNIPFMYASPGEKRAWLNAAVEYLLTERGFDIGELGYRRHRLRGALEKKLHEGLRRVKQREFAGLLQDADRFRTPDPDDAGGMVFQEGSYAYDRIYQGAIKLHKHFFPVIGNLKSEGEEFHCAQFIANEWEAVDTWVRNVERKQTSFWLQTATDRFYPDFVLRMKDGRILVIEYKGAHLAETEDSREKEQIGKLWAAASGGRCAFVMVSDLAGLKAGR